MRLANMAFAEMTEVPNRGWLKTWPTIFNIATAQPSKPRAGAAAVACDASRGAKCALEHWPEPSADDAIMALERHIQ
jgi:hypothetical protein